ncbi:protein NYNRIN-like [Scyliorhinus canicula]|uniref:protein NYNRIN-like n=1 Tax=Scyliorhinus canicula TaxID=7830 RepID=UPI0018F53F9B|nr:protein NYNRIN-like [Scyliorhinus canicula]
MEIDSSGSDGEPHDCVALTNEVCSPRPDLQDTPLQNPDMELFVDGSAFRDREAGQNCVGYAIVTSHNILKAEPLPRHLSAQAAELIALTEACKLAEGKSVTIYTDSRYAFGVTHDFGTLWKNRGFLTSTGKPITHHGLISDLLDTVLLPKCIAVCKCDAHTGKTDPVSQGNARADAAAKAAARKLISDNVNMPMLTVPIPTADIQDLQTQASREEKKEWSKAGGKVKEGVWYGPNDKPCLPRALFPHYAKLIHGKDHVSKGGMFKSIAAHWYTRGFTSYSQKFCERCVICATNNVGRGIKISPGAHPEPLRPFEHIQMDVIKLTPSEGKKYCLVMVDMFSKWVEVFPTAKQDASAVTKALLTEIIPRWGIPEKISTDNGTPFVNQALKQVGEYLGIDLRQHCAYHPASGGAVERENATLKNKLAKCCDEMGIPWTKALPVVLMYMRTRVTDRANLRPFEILFGRPPNTGIGPKPITRTLTSH